MTNQPSANQASDKLATARGSNRLDGKVAIVLGASRGIGAACAHAFAIAGATIVLAARDQDQLDDIAREIGADDATTGAVLALHTDMGDEASVQHLVKTTIQEFNRLDIAVNVAGTGQFPTPLANLATADFDRVIAVNLRGIFLAMKAEITAMLPTGAGSLVNIASTAGLVGVPGIGAYAASKHAVIALTKTAALDYATAGIRVNAVAPGPILAGGILTALPQARDAAARTTPQQRMGTPGEVAAAALWLSSDAASYITGTVLPVGGGYLAR
jgi:NAD(P)-dependent dehydrogenase (short-subunit alcohol dehydrogenase family)